MPDETVGEEIYRRRDALRLSQADLAVKADVSRNTISSIERTPDHQADKRVIQAIRDALDAAERGDATVRHQRTRLPRDTTRESIARTFEALVDALPEDLVPADSTDAAAIAIRATRRAYQHAARIARGEGL